MGNNRLFGNFLNSDETFTIVPFHFILGGTETTAIGIDGKLVELFK